MVFRTELYDTDRFKNKHVKNPNTTIGACYCALLVIQSVKPLHTKAVAKNIRTEGVKQWL